jgi:protein TonB
MTSVTRNASVTLPSYVLGMRTAEITLISLLALFIAIATPGYAQTDTREQWRKQIVIRLANNKRFPPEAKDQAGTAQVGFILDRTGRLVSHWLVESTGHRALDKESLAIVERAQPFPIPPPDIDEDHLRMIVPLNFIPLSPAVISRMQEFLQKRPR